MVQGAAERSGHAERPSPAPWKLAAASTSCTAVAPTGTTQPEAPCSSAPPCSAPVQRRHERRMRRLSLQPQAAEERAHVAVRHPVLSPQPLHFCCQRVRLLLCVAILQHRMAYNACWCAQATLPGTPCLAHCCSPFKLSQPAARPPGGKRQCGPGPWLCLRRDPGCLAAARCQRRRWQRWT